MASNHMYATALPDMTNVKNAFYLEASTRLVVQASVQLTQL